MTDMASIIIGAARQSWMHDQLATYMWSGGVEGHIVDTTALGGHLFTTTLLLKYVSRDSGAPVIVPLIYGNIGGELAILASHGGRGGLAAWFGDLDGSERLDFQVGTQAYQAHWRVGYGDERVAALQYMEKVFPPYRKHRDTPAADLPLVILSPLKAIARFSP